MDKVVEVVAAVLVLGAFAGSQLGRLDQHKVPYLTLNLVGTGVLAWLAGADRSWGFLLLEGVWALISGLSLVAVLRRRSAVETP
ncbi:MAG TPA: hypothetical protein VMZ00_14870 [Sporichthya sp.]|nr:hypothetical protein [Sporichthya sp.]